MLKASDFVVGFFFVLGQQAGYSVQILIANAMVAWLCGGPTGLLKPAVHKHSQLRVLPCYPCCIQKLFN